MSQATSADHTSAYLTSLKLTSPHPHLTLFQLTPPHLAILHRALPHINSVTHAPHTPYHTPTQRTSVQRNSPHYTLPQLLAPQPLTSLHPNSPHRNLLHCTTSQRTASHRIPILFIAPRLRHGATRYLLCYYMLSVTASASVAAPLDLDSLTAEESAAAGT